jgi:hypothetical protein
MREHRERDRGDCLLRYPEATSTDRLAPPRRSAFFIGDTVACLDRNG